MQIGSGAVLSDPVDEVAHRSIIVCAAPTSAWRMARKASTSMMMPNFMPLIALDVARSALVIMGGPKEIMGQLRGKKCAVWVLAHSRLG